MAIKSQTLPSFWEKYERLDESLKKQARKAFPLRAENPFHPSLHFKCVNPQGNVWAVRISPGYRAVGFWTTTLSHGLGLAVTNNMKSFSGKTTFRLSRFPCPYPAFREESLVVLAGDGPAKCHASSILGEVAQKKAEFTEWVRHQEFPERGKLVYLSPDLKALLHNQLNVT